MPLLEVVSWIINQVDIDNRLIKYENGKDIPSFQPSSLYIYYKFSKEDIIMIWWMGNLVDHNKILSLYIEKVVDQGKGI